MKLGGANLTGGDKVIWTDSFSLPLCLSVIILERADKWILKLSHGETFLPE